MNALEFTAEVEHGSIQLPKKLKEYENLFVRVIMLTDEIDNISKKEKLLLAIK
jgi:hypothetical protein